MREKLRAEDMQYHGDSESTQTCIDAIVRLLESRDRITAATLLTHDRRHCFYIRLAEHQDVVIRPGFTSGYPGEGPSGLAKVLLLLQQHRVAVEEVLVTSRFLARATASRLSRSDLELICHGPVVRPRRLADYTWQIEAARGSEHDFIRDQYSLSAPFGLVDRRLWDLVMLLETDPDAAISKAFRLLEETVCRRCGFGEDFGRRVFAKAFEGPESRLVWQGLHPNEVKGRLELFTGAFSARRNPRAHRSISDSKRQCLREFLLVNELFLLESEAMERTRTELK